MKILKEFRRVAKDNLIISFSLDSVWLRLRWRLKRLYEPKSISDFFSVSRDDFTAELEDAGFKVAKRKRILHVLSSEAIWICY